MSALDSLSVSELDTLVKVFSAPLVYPRCHRVSVNFAFALANFSVSFSVLVGICDQVNQC